MHSPTSCAAECQSQDRRNTACRRCAGRRRRRTATAAATDHITSHHIFSFRNPRTVRAFKHAAAAKSSCDHTSHTCQCAGALHVLIRGTHAEPRVVARVAGGDPLTTLDNPGRTDRCPRRSRFQWRVQLAERSQQPQNRGGVQWRRRRAGTHREAGYVKGSASRASRATARCTRTRTRTRTRHDSQTEVPPTAHTTP
jgi:hypothetical protein